MTGSLRSNSSTDPVPVGTVGPPHGLDGTVYVWPDTDDPTRFAPGTGLLVGGIRMRVEKTRRSSERLFVKFAEVSNRTSAEKLRGMVVSIEERRRRDLGSDEFWPDELEGLEVRNPKGAPVGRVKGVIWAAAQNRIAIETPAGVREAPFVDELVPEVNLEEGYLILMDIPGLI